MGNAIRSHLLDGLLGRQTAAVLSVLLARPETRLYQRQIAQLAGLRLLQAQRALRSLAALGVLFAQREGNRVYYSPNPSCPILPELTTMVLKTAGLADVLREALTEVKEIALAFIFGSMAKGTADAKSDVDVLIVGDASFADVSAALLSAQERLGREVTPTVYTPQEFAERLKGKHHFLTRVLSEPKIMLVGTPDDLGSDRSLRPRGRATETRHASADARPSRLERARGAAAMKVSGTQCGVTAADLLRAAGFSGQAMCEVPFAAILTDGNEDAIPPRPGAYLIVTVADRHVVGIGSTGSGPKKTGTLAKRMGTFVAAALGFPVRHSSGQRFWTTRSVHGLCLRDLTVICLPAGDPRGTECRLFAAYEDATGHLPMLCKARPARGKRA